ncbi:MAG: bacillithiol biosynthesis BshC, partial [Calditrichia bacterium]
IAYLAQTAPLYEYFELPMPVVYPRHRITLVEKKIGKITGKYRLSLEDLFRYRSEFVTRWVRRDAGEVFGEIEKIETEISLQLQQLEKLVSQLDPTLLNPVKKTDQKMKATLHQLLGKVTNAIKEREEVKINQVEKVVSQLFPENNFQERVINVIYFLIKYGPDFIDELYSSLPDDTTEHILVNF